MSRRPSKTQRTFPLAAIVMMLATAAPLASGWGAKGTNEPDTTRDISDHWMFPDADTSPTGHQVYFNGFEGACSYPECTTFSPNLATTRSSLHPSGYEEFAMLGVWKDCNGDNMIGFGDQGLWEYRAELLLASNSGACPVQPFNALNPNHVIYHNDGAWIHEFVPIQWKNWFADVNLFNINDNESRIWTDAGLPENDLGTAASSTCHIGPQPRGTYHNVGGLLYWADCFDAYAATDAFDGLAHDGKTPDVIVRGQLLAPSIDFGVKADELGAGQLSFADSPRYQGASDSMLNVKPWGEESDASYAQAWDCGQGTTPIEATPPGATTPTHVANVSQPNTSPSPGTSGSLAGTVNATASGADQCARRDEARGGTGGAYARYPYESAACFAHVPCEADEVSGLTAGKTTTLGFLPIEVARPGGAASLADKRTPPDLGAHLWPNTQRYSFGDQDFWETYVVPLSNAGTFYATTYYAYVSQTAISAYGLTLPNGGATGAYGAEACEGHTSGTWKGWQCDATLWWRGPNGEDVRPRDPTVGQDLGTGPDGLAVDVSIRVGSPFNLRDIDCTDLTLASEQRNADVPEAGIHGLAPAAAQDQAYNEVGPTLADLAPGLFAASGPVRTCP